MVCATPDDKHKMNTKNKAKKDAAFRDSSH